MKRGICRLLDQFKSQTPVASRRNERVSELAESWHQAAHTRETEARQSDYHMADKCLQWVPFDRQCSKWLYVSLLHASRLRHATRFTSCARLLTEHLEPRNARSVVLVLLTTHSRPQADHTSRTSPKKTVVMVRYLHKCHPCDHSCVRWERRLLTALCRPPSRTYPRSADRGPAVSMTS